MQVGKEMITGTSMYIEPQYNCSVLVRGPHYHDHDHDHIIYSVFSFSGFKTVLENIDFVAHNHMDSILLLMLPWKIIMQG